MNPVDDQRDLPIVPGIVVDDAGEATVDPGLTDVLLDLALHLEEPTRLPVDVEHVLAALVLAARNGELDPHVPLDSSDSILVERLVPHVRTIFAIYGGQVGKEE